jgi:2-amino-4-hydroxy-6-hydroxymethyldihydropteridine diphosphokinase
MNKVFLGLGTNIGDRQHHLQIAREQIATSSKMLIASSIIETIPWGVTSQSNYLNQVLLIETNLEALDLLAALQAIEASMGRVRKVKWEARIIDIDILFFNDEMITTAELTVPHPFAHQRKFVLTSMNEIAPDYIHPVLQKSMADLLAALPDE